MNKKERPQKEETVSKGKEMDTVITIKIPKELRREARIKSAHTGIALSFVVRRAIEAWVRGEGE